tara:strand:- start:9540 stop:9767 length:228 start_codon:yes stop_codon:yes gene_type:complete
MNEKDDRLYEFRIEYISNNSIGHNFHYYLARNPQEALSYQLEIMNHKHWKIKLIKLEKKCPYSNKWHDESSILNQ